MSYSLFVNLTKTTEESYPATSVSKFLIETIGKDVCAFRRNTQASYRLVEQARIISSAINSLIKRVDEIDDWDAFDKYTAAIDPLEASLFPLVDTVEKERDQYLTQQDSVDLCIAFIESWDVQRATIREALGILRTKEEFKKLIENQIESEADLKAAYQHDDTRFLSELVKRVEQYGMEKLSTGKRDQGKLGILSRTVDTIIKDVCKELKAVETRVISAYPRLADESFVWSVKISMILYGVMELIQNTKLEEAWIVHAKSDVIWKAAQGLVKLLRAHLEQSGTKPTTTDIKSKYDGFLTLLRGSMAVKLPPNFIQLMKHAGRIPRSYQTQALYLVKLCRELAKHFEQPVNQTAQNLEPLKEAIDETLKALEAAKQQQDTALSNFDITAVHSNAVMTGLTTAKDDIKHCFEKFGLTSQWDDRVTKLQQSIDKDKEHMQLFNDRINKGVVAVDKTALVKTIIKVCKGSADTAPVKQIEYSLRPTTRLTAIQWQACKEQYTDQALNKGISTSAYFVKPAQKNDKLGGDVDISSLVSQGSQCELVLVIA